MPSRLPLRPWCILGVASLVCRADPPDEPIRWEYSTGGAIYSSVTLGADGTAYVGSGDNKVYALSSDGTLKWEYETGDWVDAVPALSEDGATLYVGSWDNKLYALSTADGSLAWSYETGNYILASPSVGPDGTIYFGSNDSFFYALNSDGTLKWEYFLETEETVGIHSSAAIGEDGTVYFGSQDGRMYALNTDGTLKWSYQAETGANGENRIASSPALDADGNLYFGTGSGAFHSVDAQGAQRWTYRLLEESQDDETLDSSPVVDADGNVYFATREGFLVALDSEGVELWSATVGDVFYSAPLVDSEGNLYIPSYFGAYENEDTGQTEDVSGITAFDSSGTQLWEYPLIYGYIDSSPALDANGILYIGASDGSVVALDTGSGNSLATDAPWPKLRNTLSGQGRSSGLVFQLDSTELGNGWFASHWLGAYYDYGSGWAYHYSLGWTNLSGGDASVWAWLPTPSTWYWTSQSTYPFLYRQASGYWIYHSSEHGAYYHYGGTVGWSTSP